MRAVLTNIFRGVVSKSKGEPRTFYFKTRQGNVQDIYTGEDVLFEFEYFSINPVENITINGTLPTGIQFNDSGIIFGKVTSEIEEVKDYPFTITLIDDMNNSITGSFSVQERPYVTEVFWQTPPGELYDTGAGAVIYGNFDAESKLV